MKYCIPPLGAGVISHYLDYTYKLGIGKKIKRERKGWGKYQTILNFIHPWRAGSRVRQAINGSNTSRLNHLGTKH